jgi:acylphosphatase
MKRAHVIVQGRVQGVYYRASARDHARRLNLTGWARNCPDGSVELVVEGERRQIEQLIAWCHKGPPAAVVTQVEVEWQTATGEFEGFFVKY